VSNPVSGKPVGRYSQILCQNQTDHQFSLN